MATHEGQFHMPIFTYERIDCTYLCIIYKPGLIVKITTGHPARYLVVNTCGNGNSTILSRHY